jgi:hypothetical protein
METGNKIYMVVWCSNNNGEVENGAIPCKDMETAKDELGKLYKQALSNFSETTFDEDGGEDTNINCNNNDYDETSYYIDNVDGDVFERGEIDEASVK